MLENKDQKDQEECRDHKTQKMPWHAPTVRLMNANKTEGKTSPYTTEWALNMGPAS